MPPLAPSVPQNMIVIGREAGVSGEAAHQVARIAHRGEFALLIEHALAADGRVARG